VPKKVKLSLICLSSRFNNNFDGKFFNSAGKLSTCSNLSRTFVLDAKVFLAKVTHFFLVAQKEN
jgi:nucleosome binding factor SPN SPT16 subunit